MSTQSNTEVIDPTEIISQLMAEELDRAFSDIEGLLRTYLAAVFSSDESFLDMFTKVYGDRDRLRLIVRRFISEVLPKVIMAYTLAGSNKHPIIERFKELYLVEVVHNGLYRAFYEVLYTEKGF